MSLSNKVDQFSQDADIVHQIVHGDASTVVTTTGGPVRSLAKLLADNQAALNVQVNLVSALGGPGGAAMVSTSDGTTVQATTDSIKASVTALSASKANASDLAAKANASDLAAKANTSDLAAKADLKNAVLINPTFKGYIEQLQVLTGAAITFDPTLGTLAQITLAANTTITLPTPVDGMSFTLVLVYGGAFTPTFAGGGTLRWANGNTIPTPTKVTGAMDKYYFTCMSSKTLAQDSGRNF